MSDANAPRRIQRVSIGLAALAFGLFAIGCSTTSTTNATTGSTPAKPTGSDQAIAPASGDVAGIPTFKVTVMEEAGASTSASATTMKPATATAGGTSQVSMMPGESTTSMNQSSSGTTQKMSDSLLNAPADPGGTMVPGSAPGAHMDGPMTKMSFQSPDVIPTGLVMIDLQNTGKQTHQINIARPRNLRDIPKIDQALKTAHPELALALVDFVGGSNSIEAGGEQKTVSQFDAGTYYFICFILDADGARHTQHGMVKKVTTTPGDVMSTTSSGGTIPADTKSSGTMPKGTVAPAPVSGDQLAAMTAATVGEIKLKDFLITFPDTFAGKGWYKVNNDEGKQPHEVSLLRLADGKTKQDAIDWVSSGSPTNPPPFASAGGFGGLSPKGLGWVQLDLKPGAYVALCFIPNTIPSPNGPPGPPDLKPHFMSGMITEFSIK